MNWAALQPDPIRPAELSRTVDGCARGIAPCGAYEGIAGELAAIASQQRAGAPFHVVIQILGTPAWAASAPSGCESADTPPSARPPRPAALASYRALVAALLSLGRREGVALEWWSPWNEPNTPRSLSPQRDSCAKGAPTVSPAAYAQLVRALAAELGAQPGTHHLLLGELNALEADTAHATSIAAFIAALPSDVLCVGNTFTLHAYATRASVGHPVADPVATLETALDARGTCGQDARIWVSEAGAGAPHPGSPRPPGAADELAGCGALAAQLERWRADPRVDAVLQYTFREDPAFPVGLASPDLTRLYPAYGLWLAFARAGRGGVAPALARACS